MPARLSLTFNQSSYTESSIHSFPFLQHFQRTLFVMHLQTSRYKVTVVIPTGVSHHIYTPKMLSSLLSKPIATKHGRSKSFLKYYPVQHNLLTFQQTRVKKKETRLDFDNRGSVASRDYRSLLGISKTAFDNLLTEVWRKVWATLVKTVQATLGVFFI